MGDVASHDDGALQVHSCGDRVLRQLGAHGIDALREVYLNALRALARTTQSLGNKLCGVRVHHFEPNAVTVDLSLDVAVGRAADAHADGAAGTVTRQTDNADVVSHVFAAELCAEPDVVGFLQQLLLQVDVAEGTACLVARRGQ